MGIVVERKIMSLLTNSRNDLQTCNSVGSVVVPSASVWDVARHDGRSVGGGANSRHIRTLRVENRTTYRSNCMTVGGFEKISERRGSSAGRSNTGNYILGAVFGVAVFVGTLVGGLAGAEGSSAPQPLASEVQQVEAAVSR